MITKNIIYVSQTVLTDMLEYSFRNDPNSVTMAVKAWRNPISRRQSSSSSFKISLQMLTNFCFPFVLEKIQLPF